MRPRSSSINWPGAIAAGALAFSVIFAALRFLAPSPPDLVKDRADILTPEQRARIGEFHGFLLKDHGIDYRVETVRNVGGINRAAAARFAELSAGMQSPSGQALLLLIDSGQDVVRLEVSHSLEPVYTDAFTKYIETRQMVPFFQADRVADGILATTELIVARAQEAARQGAFDSDARPAQSGGGGAVSPANIGKAGEAAPSSAGDVAPGTSPEETLEHYFAAMAARNGNPDLGLYTDDTRAMLKSWVITPAQMDMVVKSYRACRPEPVRRDAGLAVIRFSISERACAPFFFRKTAQGWQLDLTMMQLAIRFGRTNAWRFDMSVDHPYRFAFADWMFDRNGFPMAPK